MHAHGVNLSVEEVVQYGWGLQSTTTCAKLVQSAVGAAQTMADDVE